MSGLFSELPEFLKEYIHENRWESFRRIQEETFDNMMLSDDDIIISSGTSSGKTEAALFPVIASLYDEPSESIGALYISPLKALINDQYSRISRILERSGITVTGWHGDVDRYIKDRLKDDPKGILQMTPESLQALVGGDPDSARRMFSDLRFVIIDEMHAFMDSERGLQLLCCLDRIENIASCHPRRLGLSATISDLDVAREWIRSNRDANVMVIEGDGDSKRNVAISYHHLPRTDAVEGVKPRNDAIADYYRKLLQVTDRNRCIVFANSRDTVEKTYRSMKKVLDRMGSNRQVMLHHGRLSQEKRKATESALNSSTPNVTVVATSTLEMGIDIGDMDRIVQIDAPHSCSSLLQRMGRSGRRGNVQTLAIMCREDEDRKASPEMLRMNLIKAIAEVQLAVDEGWSEPPNISSRPYGLLLHQTLEYLRAGVGAKWVDLERDVLSQYPFRNIARDEYRKLLRHMIAQRILTVMDDDTLLIGTEGERIAFSKDFHTVFRSLGETEIFHNGEMIGNVEGIPEIGDIINVADQLWIVRSVDNTGRSAEVEPAPDGSVTTGRGMIPEVHPIVSERMRDIMSSMEVDERLTGSAKDALTDTRGRFSQSATDGFVMAGEIMHIHVWNGSRAYRTLRLMLETIPEVKVLYSFEPYVIRIMTELSPKELSEECDRISATDPVESILRSRINLRFGKFDRYVPDELLARSYADDRLDWRKGILPI